MLYNRRISPYLCPCRSVLAMHFKTLLNLSIHTGVTLSYTLMIFFTINPKGIILQHNKFHIYTLKMNTIIWHCKKNPMILKRKYLSLKQFDPFSNFVHYKRNNIAWGWSNAVDIWLSPWILMAQRFNNKASVATMLSRHPCMSSCLWVYSV